MAGPFIWNGTNSKALTATASAANFVYGFNTTATSAGTLTLTGISAGIQQLTGTSTHDVVLPATNLVALGFQFQIINRSTQTVTVKDSTGGTVQAMATQTVLTVTASVSGAPGTWDVNYNDTAFAIPLAVAKGGTGTTTGSITGTGALTFTAGGTNENVTLTPSGTGANISSSDLLVGTTTPPTSRVTPGQVIVTGLGVYPFPIVSAGALSQNSSIKTAITQTNTINATGTTQETNLGIAAINYINNSGAGTNFTGLVGTYSTAYAGSTAINSVFNLSGLSAIAARALNTDTSTSTNNLIYGGQYLATHSQNLPSTAVSGNLWGVFANVIVNSGTAITASGVHVLFDVANLTSAQASTVTNAYMFNGARLRVGAASGGPGTITNGYGISLQGPVVNATGTMTTFYGVWIGAKSGTGTLTNNYGVYQTDATALNYFAGNVGVGTNAPGSTSHVAGSFQVKLSALSANTTLDGTYHAMTVDASGAARTITLPAASASIVGRVYRIKKIDSSANAVTIARTGSDTIDGAPNYLLTTQYQSVDVICSSATTWSIF